MIKEFFINAGERRDIETYKLIGNLLNTTQIDNMKILKALFRDKDGQLPLFDGSMKKRVKDFVNGLTIFSETAF